MVLVRLNMAPQMPAPGLEGQAMGGGGYWLDVEVELRAEMVNVELGLIAPLVGIGAVMAGEMTNCVNVGYSVKPVEDGEIPEDAEVCILDELELEG